jgi:hypothetical protein
MSMTTNRRRWITVALLTTVATLGLANGSAWSLAPGDPDHPTTADGGAVSEDETSSSIDVPVSLPCSPTPEPAPEPAPGPTPSTTLAFSGLQRQAAPPPVTCETDAGDVKAEITGGKLCVTITTDTTARPYFQGVTVTDADGKNVAKAGGKYCVTLDKNGKGKLTISGEINWHQVLANRPFTVVVSWDPTGGWTTKVTVL